MQHQPITHPDAPDSVSVPESVSVIEARLHQDRSALSASVDALRNRLSFDALWDDAVSLVKSNATPYTQALDTAVRANPTALALTSVGLAWLILGRRTPADPDANALAGTKYEAVSRWEDEGGPVSSPPARNDDWMDEADRLRDRAAVMITRINAAARDKLAPAHELARSRAEVLAALTQDVRHAMGRGLENLVGTAHTAALATREQAYALHMRARQAGATRVRQTPLATGLVLAAVGAGLATLLPRSSIENRLMGAPRDQLVAETRRMMQDERQRLAASVQKVAKTLVAELAPSRST